MVSLQRRAEFANRIELIILDIDEGKGLDMRELHEKLYEKDLNHWIYTTVSHTVESPKFRVIIEANGLMTPDLYNQCIIGVSVILKLVIGPPGSGSHVDSTSRDVVHAMFLPTLFKSNPDMFEQVYYTDGHAFSPKDIEWEAVETIIQRLSTSDKSNISYSQPPMEGLTRETINAVLKQIGHMAVEYEDWLKVGMAIHHQFGGSDEGHEIWDHWSRSYGEEKYDKTALIGKWQSFTGARAVNLRAITFRSCFSWAIQEDWKPTVSREDLTPIFQEIQSLRQDAESAGTPEEIRIAIDGLAEKVRYTPMLAEHREEIVIEIAHLSKQHALPYTKGHIRTKFAYANVLSLSRAQAPFWCKDHIYVSAWNNIYLPQKQLPLREDAYNNTFNTTVRESMTYDPAANLKTTKVKPTPWERSIDWYKIPKVDDVRFEPGREMIFRNENGVFFNSYIKKKISMKPRETWTEQETKFIETLRDHFVWMYAPHHVRTILTFIAICIFEPRTKIRWAIFLHSDAQGIGKSLFYEIAKTFMGNNLISVVKSRQIADTSSRWKQEKKLVVVEEARLREADMEDLKDDISNDRMQIRTMFHDSVEVSNFLNFMFISNNLDGIKIQSDKDRRYYVASSPISNRSDMYKRLRTIGVSEKEVLAEMERNQEFGRGDEDIPEEEQVSISAFSKYMFTPYFGGIKKYEEAICGWMKEVYDTNKAGFDVNSPKLTDEFKRIARASGGEIDDILEDVIGDEVDKAHVNHDFIVVGKLWDIVCGENPTYERYTIPQYVRRRSHIATASSLRNLLVKRYRYFDILSFVYDRERYRVLSADSNFFRNKDEKQLREAVRERIIRQKELEKTT